MHILKSAHLPHPLLDLNPEENGWHFNGETFEFNWFDGDHNPPIDAMSTDFNVEKEIEEEISLHQSSSDEEDFDDWNLT